MKSLQIVMVGNEIFEIGVVSSAYVIINFEVFHLFQAPVKKIAHIQIHVETDIIHHIRSNQCRFLSHK